jgi:hypothetical protein
MWFGGWTPEEYAHSRSLLPRERLKYLDGINDRRGVKWQFKAQDLWPVQRFYDVTPENWVVTCFDGRIHLGHVSGPVMRGEDQFDREKDRHGRNQSGHQRQRSRL